MSAHTKQNMTAGTIHELSLPHHAPNTWDILVKSDLLNVLILALAFVYLGNKFLPQILDQRKKQISKELEDAKAARIKADEELKIIKEKTKNITLEIEEIKEEAKKTALTIKKQIEEDTEKELSNLRQKVKKEITSNQEEAIQDIKKSASSAAIKLAEEALSQVTKNQEIQKKLLSDFMAGLDNPSKN